MIDLEVTENYVISPDTMVVRPVMHQVVQAEIIDVTGKHYSTKTPKEIMTESCSRYLNSFEGSLQAVRQQFNFTKEPPLVIDKAKELIAISSKPPTSPDCTWYFYHHINLLKTLSSSNRTSPIIYFHNETDFFSHLEQQAIKSCGRIDGNT